MRCSCVFVVPAICGAGDGDNAVVEPAGRQGEEVLCERNARTNLSSRRCELRPWLQVLAVTNASDPTNDKQLLTRNQLVEEINGLPSHHFFRYVVTLMFHGAT